MTVVILVVAFLVFTAWREWEHRDEVREMAQRIQAPERAVREASKVETQKPRPRRAPVVALDDDEAVSEALDGDSHVGA